jgi:hypothetical protein
LIYYQANRHRLMERKIRCITCGMLFHSDEALMAWLSGKSPNPISCPGCGGLMPDLSRRYQKDGADKGMT